MTHPTIDVTDIVTDPDLSSHFVVTRFAESVDEHGRAVLEPQLIDAIGTIQPASGRALQLLPDLTRVSGAVEVWTSCRLQVQTDRSRADQFSWFGKTYLVLQVDDFGDWGRGYIHAVATLTELTGPGQ